ncbi:hypothetical protein MicloDRAFT_00045930 [Microvirga lotononidis]|uniref:Uncharacterized protein n=1 Tax=Microvirga lotononidis TaxID=864069 RepID=I4YVM4_9HYPH|nr:hypothetical protein MicloDRAFT_00045930 [Microvirga lotononidis]
MRAQRGRLSPKSESAKAINYMLRRWSSFALFLDDGRVCLSNNAAERAIRGIAVGRRNWTFAGSDVGGHRAAALYTLVETCKLNEVDPRAWLADVLARLPEHPSKRLNELALDLEGAAGRASRGLISGLSREQRLEELFGFLQAFLGEDDGFGLIGRIADETLLVEPICCAPVKTLPGPAPIVQRQPH